MNKILLTLQLVFFLCTNSIQAQILFTDNSNRLVIPNVKSGAPMGVVDMNNDGRDDIVQLDGTSHLYIQYQNEDTTFTGFDGGLVTGSQWSLCVADVDKNGFNDIFTGGAYNNLKLLKATATGNDFILSNVTGNIFLQGSNFADIDNDGKVDIFACHDDGISHPYRNNGTGNFLLDFDLINPVSTVMSDNSGNYGSIWTDYDNDGDLDLYLSKCRQGVDNPMDGRRLNQLFQNDGNGNYTDVATAAGLQPMAQSWATDFADIDNDGDLDAFIINHDQSSVLMENQANGTFVDITASSGMAATLASAGLGIQVKFEDFDNDGFVDLLVTAATASHLLFHNNGDKTFTKLDLALSPFNKIHSAATGDLNSDGFIDVYVSYGTSFNAVGTIPDRLYLNEGNSNNYFKAALRGEFSNANGIGARVELYGDWGKQIREVRSGESYGIMTSFTCHFGLGTATTIDSAIIKWPSGVVDKIIAPTINQQLTVEEGIFCQETVAFSTISNSLVVNFQNESSVESDQWFWTFGDGITSSSQNPSHTYIAPGMYEVCLTIGGTCMDCQTIAVNCPLPDASYASFKNGLEVSFQDQSAFGPTDWLWTFGNAGETSTEQNPSFTFDSEGTYEVCLIASNVCGNTQFCDSITVSCFVDPIGFSPSVTELDVIFSPVVDSTVNSILWEFGDGNASTDSIAQHSYANPGTYTVCLTISSDCGSRQVCDPISVSCPLPSVGYDFTIEDLSVEFEDNSSDDVTQWLWDFGDGGTSDEQNPSHTYNQDGTYQVCLTATSSCGSTETCMEVALNCSSPLAGFEANADQLSVSFNNQSAGNPTTALWDFGDGNTSTDLNPTHNFAQAGTYEICLISSNGCGSSEACGSLTVSCPEATSQFIFSADELDLTFQDMSSGSPSTWLWEFGDGTTSSLQNPTYSYSAPGNFEVCLTTTNDCFSSTECQTLSLSCSPALPEFNFTSSGLTVTYENLLAAPGNTYGWDLGDGSFSGDANPVYTYSESGIYQVCLTVVGPCGGNTNCETIMIGCSMPEPAFYAESNELAVVFQDTSSVATDSLIWIFGDGDTSFVQSPQHDYPAPGIYEVCLIALNNCGVDTTCQTLVLDCSAPGTEFSVLVEDLDISLTDISTNVPTEWLWTFGNGDTSTERHPQYKYNVPGTYEVCLTATNICGSTTVCEALTISCTATAPPLFTAVAEELIVNFEDNSDDEPFNWFWTFGDSTISTEENPNHFYILPGTYEVCLVTTTICGESPAVCQEITVNCSAPQSLFSFEMNELAVNFQDISTNDPVSWLWTFGDGDSAMIQNPTHIFDQPGTYEICLEVASDCGITNRCEDIQVVCASPVASFGSIADELVLTFADSSSNNPESWFWTFGDGDSSTVQNPQHEFELPGTYNICLQVTSLCGSTTICEDVVVSCNTPAASFSAINSELEVNFVDLSTSDPEEWLWDFGDGVGSSGQNPSHIYDLPGDYEVCLTVSNICGSSVMCTTISVSCSGPEANFEYEPDGLTVSFSDISTLDPTDWLWDFGSGTFSIIQNPVHSFQEEGIYTVCLITSNICGSDTICQELNLIIDAVDDPFTQQEVILYPNPAKDLIALEFIDFEARDIRLSTYNLAGQQVLPDQLLDNGAQAKEINISTLPPGTYLFKIQTRDGNLVKRFVKF